MRQWPGRARPPSRMKRAPELAAGLCSRATAPETRQAEYRSERCQDDNGRRFGDDVARRSIQYVTRNDLHIVAVTTKDAAPDVGIDDTDRAIRVQEDALDKVSRVSVTVVVNLKSGAALKTAPTDEIVEHLILGNAVENHLIIEIHREANEIQDHAVARGVTIDRQYVRVRRIKARHVEHTITVPVEYARGGIDRQGRSTAGPNLDTRPRLATECRVQQVDRVQGSRHVADTVVNAAGNDVADIVVAEPAGVRASKVDAAIDGGRTAVCCFRRRASNPDIEIDGDIRDLERIVATPFIENRVVRGVPQENTGLGLIAGKCGEDHKGGTDQKPRGKRSLHKHFITVQKTAQHNETRIFLRTGPNLPRLAGIVKPTAR